MPSLSESFQANKELTKQNAKSFYLASLFLPREQKKAIYSVYGFCRISDDLVDNIPVKNQVKEALRIWKKKIKTGLKTGDSQDLNLKSFIWVVKKYHIPEKYIWELVEGVEVDTVQNRWQNYKELENYCYLVASVVGLLLLPIIGKNLDKKTITKAISLGKAMQLTNILRDVKEDWGRKRIYIPLDLLEKYNLNESLLTKILKNPKSSNFLEATSNFEKIILDLAKIAKQEYLEALTGIQFLKPAIQPGILVAVVLYRAILLKILKNPEQVIQSRVMVSNSQKNWLILKTLLIWLLPVSWKLKVRWW